MRGFQALRYDVVDGLATITLSRPDKRNAMDRRMFEELAEAAHLASEAQDVRGVMVAGDGPSFCAGIDLDLLRELTGIDRGEFRETVRGFQRPFLMLATMAKPTLAAVHGHALGAGCQLALACDLRVAAPDVHLAILEPRYGLVPDLGGIHRLTELLGPARAKELVWSARSVDAEEAGRLGLVNRVSSPGALLDEARAFLAEATAHPPTVVWLSKALIDGAGRISFAEQLERDADAQVIAVLGEPQTDRGE
jgi:enoyl-CoA hydratase/carnithine racemase